MLCFLCLRSAESDINEVLNISDLFINFKDWRYLMDILAQRGRS